MIGFKTVKEHPQQHYKSRDRLTLNIFISPNQHRLQCTLELDYK